MPVTRTEHQAEGGLFESEKKVWLHAFSNLFTTAAEIYHHIRISSNISRKALNAQAEP